MKKNTIKQLSIVKYILLSIFGLFAFMVNGQTTQTFTVSGTWTAPSCVTRVSAEVWGAGGGGAGNSTGADGGGGGAGGGYSRALLISVTPFTTYTVTVGVGGAFGLMAADATADGGPGGASWFKNNTTVFANGGGGGSRPNSGLGGNGGAAGLTGTGGDATYAGGNGGSGRDAAAGFGGGGGSSAGTGFVANGFPGTNNGGVGGVAPAGGGNGGDGTLNDGLPGLWPGGGGGGAGSNGKGGAGAAGKVFLDWTSGMDAKGNMNSANSSTVCSGVALAIGLSSDAGASTFVWKAADNPNTTGESTTDQTLGTINDVITNTSNVVQFVTYTVTPTSTAGCIGNPQIVTARIDPRAFITLTSAVGTDSQTVCQNSPITNITYTITGGGTNAGVTALPAGVNGSFSGGVFTISGTPSVSGSFDYRITTTGNCTQTFIDGKIIVVSPTSVVLTSILNSDNQSVCVNTPIVDITYSVGGGTTAVASGLPSGVSGSFAGGTLTIKGTPNVVGVSNYTVTTTGVCPSQTVTGKITVIPDAKLILTSASFTDHQTVCESTPITPITYSLTGGATGALVTFSPAGIVNTLDVSTNVLTLSGQTAATGTYGYTVVTTGSPCKQDTVIGSITITPTTAIVLTSIAGSQNQSVCMNDFITDITYNTGGPAVVSGLPAGVSGFSSGSVFTIKGKPTVMGTFNYTVTTAGSCTPVSTSGTITVNPEGLLGLASAIGTDNQTVCESSPITDITYTVSGGNTGFAISPLPLGFGATYPSGPSSMTISGQTAASGTYTYTVISTGTCRPDTLTGSITIIPTTAIALTSVVGSNNQAICVNTPLTDITYNTGVISTVSPLPPGVSGSYAAGVFTIKGTPTVAGNYTYTVTTAGSCPPVSANGAITVLPDGFLSLASAAGTDHQIVCENTPITTITYTLSGGATAFAISPLPLGFGTTYPVSPSSINIDGQTAASGTYTYTIITTGNACKQDTLTGSISINPTTALVLTSGAGTDAQIVCVNDQIINITYNVGSGATVSPLPAGISGSLAGGVFTISGKPTAVGNYSYTVTTSSSCTPVSANGTITVNPEGTLTLTSAPGTDKQYVCEGDPITDVVYTVGGGNTTITISPLFPAGIGTVVNGSSVTITGQTAINGTYPYTVISSGACRPDTLKGFIAIGPTSALVLSSAVGTDNQIVCENMTIQNITYNVGSGATVTSLPTGVTGSYAAGVFTIGGKPSVAGNFTYTVTTTGSCGTLSANGAITVNPSSNLTLTSAAGTDAQSTCVNVNITPITYSITGAATGAVVTGLPAGINNSISGGVLTISGQTASTGTFNYTVTSTGGTCLQDTVKGSITISSSTSIALSSAPSTNSQTVCENVPITNITYTVSGATSAAASTLPAGVVGAYAGGVFSITGTPTVAGNYTYTVSTTGGCSVQTASGSIRVNPNGALTLTSASGTDAQEVCVSNTITNITYSVGGSANLASVTALPTGVSGTYSAGVFTISGTPTVSGTYNYTVTTTGTACTQKSLTGFIKVNTGASITLTSAGGTDAQTVCENASIVNITYSVTGGATPSLTALPTGVSSSFAASVLTITGAPSVAGTYAYTVSASGGCPLQSTAGTFTVNPNATIALSSAIGTDAQNVCVNFPITAITYTIGGGATNASVSALPAGVSSSFSAGVFTISGTPSVSGITDYTVTTTGSCTQKSLTGQINVSAPPTIALSSAGGSDAQTVCEFSAINNITYTVGGGATGASATALPAGVNGLFSPGVFTISGSPTAPGVTGYTVTTTGTCPQVTATGTVTVNQSALIALSSAVGTDAQTKCKNEAITDITYSITGAGTGATVTNTLPAGVNGAFAGSVFTISGTPTVAGVFGYTVTPTGSCVNQVKTGTIIVGVDATIALTSGAGSDGQAVCQSGSIAGINYTIGGGTGANVLGLPSGVSGSYASGVYSLIGVPIVVGTHHYTVTTTGTCAQQASTTGTITVNPDATIALLSPAGTSSQTICIGTPITAISYSVSGGGTNATVTTLPAGLSGSFSSGVFTISGTATVAGTKGYTVTTTGGGCLQASLPGTITIKPNATLTLTSATTTAAQSACLNAAIVPIKYTVGGGGTGATVTGQPAGVAGSFAAGVETISGTPTALGLKTYTVTTTGGGCKQAKLSGSINVQEATISLSSATETVDQTVCSTSSISDIVFAVGGTATSASVSPSLPANLQESPGANYTISGTLNNAPEGPSTYTVTTTGGACTAKTQTFNLTVVNPKAKFAADPLTGKTGVEVHFDNTSENALTYNWNFGNGDSTNTAVDTLNTYSEAGDFKVRLIASSSAQCHDTAYTHILVEKVGISNVFTPNGDKNNDLFAIDLPDLESINVEIYNRWGQKVFEWNNLAGEWDGTNMHTHKPCEDGTYYYIVKAKEKGGKQIDKTGFITIQR